jgi:hypothetical protein
MVRDETDNILDDLLSRWHQWAKGFKVCPEPGADPMFRGVKSGRSWDSTAEIIEDELSSSTMEAIDFQVSEMAEPGRTAIYVNARNCYTGRSVWLSPRLPQDPAIRAVILLEARTELIRRLLRAGVM